MNVYYDWFIFSVRDDLMCTTVYNFETLAGGGETSK